MSTTITTEIVRQSETEIVARLNRPAGFVLPRHATEGLLKAEVAKALGTTPRELRWYVQADRRRITPTSITLFFEPSLIEEHADGSMSLDLGRLGRRR